MTSSQVERSSLLGTWSVWGKESSSIIVGGSRLKRWKMKGANRSSSARVLGRCSGPAKGREWEGGSGWLRGEVVGGGGGGGGDGERERRVRGV